MKRLRGKKIVLGISAGIAAYKIPFLVRLLKKEGASVRVILTPDAHAFVTLLTLSVLSQEAVLSSFVSEDTDNPVWNDRTSFQFEVRSQPPCVVQSPLFPHASDLSFSSRISGKF